MAMSVVYTTVNGQILRENRGGVVSDFVPDPLGSVVMVQDAAGAAVYRAGYDPYGNVQSETGTNPSSLGYVGTLGCIKESATSMYVRARYLLSNLGRWLTKDPLWPFEPGYVYAEAAPSIWVDIFGLHAVIPKPPCDGKHEADWKKYCGSGLVPTSYTCAPDPTPECPELERKLRCDCCKPGEMYPICVGTGEQRVHTCPGGKPSPTPTDNWLLAGCLAQCTKTCEGLKIGAEFVICYGICAAACFAAYGKPKPATGFFMKPSIQTGRPGIIIGYGWRF